VGTATTGSSRAPPGEWLNPSKQEGASVDCSSRFPSYAPGSDGLQEGPDFGSNLLTMATAFSLLGLTLPVTSVPLAAESGETALTIAEGETLNNDLFFAGESTNVKGQVRGDLFFIGKSVRVDGAVSGDLVAGLQDLMLSGNIQGDIWRPANTFASQGTPGVISAPPGSVSRSRERSTATPCSSARSSIWLATA